MIRVGICRQFRSRCRSKLLSGLGHHGVSVLLLQFRLLYRGFGWLSTFCPNRQRLRESCFNWSQLLRLHLS